MMTPAKTTQVGRFRSENRWKSSGEVGSIWGILFVARVADLLGRTAARLILPFIVAYFFVTRPALLCAAVDFRRRARAPVDPAALFRHLLCFAECALDRMYFLLGQLTPFRVYRVGHEQLLQTVQGGQGAILLGSHLGSFEVMRAASRHYEVPLSIVADFANAQRLNAILEKFGDNTTTRFIDASGDRVAVALAVKAAVEAGGLVAILADRAGHGRSVEVNFMGGRALFPVGPYLLAAAVGCPVLFTVGIYERPNRYELFCEPFSERIVLPRGKRDQAALLYAQAYATRLESFARRAPDNWFNFYPFWTDS